MLVRITRPRRWQRRSVKLQRAATVREIYAPDAPEGVGKEKYADTAAAMIAQLKHGSGMPLCRLEQLEESLGIPLPVAAPW